MFNFFGIYIAAILLVPSLVLAIFGVITYYSLLVVSCLLSMYYVTGIFKPKRCLGVFQYHIDKKFLYLIAICYFLSRGEYLISIYDHVSDGVYFEYARSLAIARYAGTSENTLAEKISTIMFIAFFTALGMRNKLTYSQILIMLIMIGVESTSLARAGVLLAMGAFGIEVIIRRRIDIMRASPWTWAIAIGVIGILLGAIFIFSAYFRLSNTEDVFVILSEKALEYTIAMYQAFSMWLISYGLDNIDFGYNTIGGLFKIFGVLIPQGHYTPVVTDFGETNIYTILRGLIQDFTLIGAMIFFLLAGLVFRFADFCFNLHIYLLARYIGYIILYFIISPFVFFTVIAGFTLPLFFLKTKFFSRKSLNV